MTFASEQTDPCAEYDSSPAARQSDSLALNFMSEQTNTEKHIDSATKGQQ